VKAILDVDYRGDKAIAACLLFKDWADEKPHREFTIQVKGVAPYEPGAFYKRELPCLLAALAKVTETIDCVVIDGNVWLDDGKHGLGAHLFDAIQKPVIGIAKTAFNGSTFAQHVLRGVSQKPLFVTAAGMDPTIAAQRVVAMHGEHRAPTMVKLVDRLCRRS
jgi:deoxyribonuclease V